MSDLQPGLFVVPDGATSLSIWGAGNPAAWSIQTGEYTAGESAFMKRPSRLYMDCTGNVTVTMIRDGVSVPVYTTSGAVRGVPCIVRLPGGVNSSLGYRIAFKFEGAAGSELHSARILGE